ncbi:hypothetical protein scyTo_0019017, partial [Scyliorhinus torazame]|nr:hypothetical protein [Scyliorhinus torazame]
CGVTKLLACVILLVIWRLGLLLKEKPENRMSCLRGSEISANKRPKTKTAVLQAQRRKLLEQETNKQAKEMSHKKANEQDKLIQDNHRKELTSTLQRTCNGDKQQDCCYFLDATKEGNIGRFFNHSCDPNLMVQSVFVDTHDKNFPWVAFFTNRYIKAGSELTWDYRYSTGSMPEEEIPCLCGSANCRDRIV